ncbi:TetR/AcrR family transcriptional regulator [Streptomyces sp. NPDC127595]|uniref:TetR/AcrR family transcriptional regulator n=1 Tax=Streptomyces sp. NPDC127595 TaxID=3345405 RepID=UPI00362DB46E
MSGTEHAARASADAAASVAAASSGAGGAEPGVRPARAPARQASGDRAAPSSSPDGQVPSLIERRKAATRMDIARAAAGLFMRNGLRATRAEDIARAAGIAPRTFYRYFASKEESLAPLFAAGAQKWAETVRDAPVHLTVPEALHHGVVQTMTPGVGVRAESLQWVRSLLRLAEGSPALLRVWGEACHTAERTLAEVLAARAGTAVGEDARGGVGAGAPTGPAVPAAGPVTGPAVPAAEPVAAPAVPALPVAAPVPPAVAAADAAPAEPGAASAVPALPVAGPAETCAGPAEPVAAPAAPALPVAVPAAPAAAPPPGPGSSPPGDPSPLTPEIRLGAALASAAVRVAVEAWAAGDDPADGLAGPVALAVRNLGSLRDFPWHTG